MAPFPVRVHWLALHVAQCQAVSRTHATLVCVCVGAGCGGTQRLIRAVGKAKAMDMILTGDMVDANEARDFGLVTKVVAADETLDEAVKMASKIASFSQPIIAMAKEAVNAAYEMTQAEGVRFERRLFHSTFATNDQKEGMGAFMDKRKPDFTDS